MARLSMSDIWDETVAFSRRERGLLIPLGFATFGIALLLIGLAAPTEGQTRPGPWMIWMLPGFLLVTIGYLAVSALVLIPNISVREALRVATARLPAAILVSVMLIGIVVLLLVVITMIVGVVGARLGWSVERAAVASLLVALFPLFWVAVRLILLWPVLVERGQGPAQAVARSLALTSGHGWRIAAMILLASATYMIVTGVAQLVGGSVFLLIGRAVGLDDLGHMLSAVLVSGIGAILVTVWSVFVSLLYRRLAGSISGT